MKFTLAILLIFYCLKGYAQGIPPYYNAKEFYEKGGAVLYNSRDILYGKVETIISIKKISVNPKSSITAHIPNQATIDTIHFYYPNDNGLVEVKPKGLINQHRFFYPRYIDSYFKDTTSIIDTTGSEPIIIVNANGEIIGAKLLDKGDDNTFYTERYKYESQQYLTKQSIYRYTGSHNLTKVYDFTGKTYLAKTSYSDSFLTERSVYNKKNKRELKEVYIYNEGHQLKEIKYFTNNNRVVDRIIFIYKRFDDHKNWTKRYELKIKNENTIVEEMCSIRKILYYPEKYRLKFHK